MNKNLDAAFCYCGIAKLISDGKNNPMVYLTPPKEFPLEFGWKPQPTALANLEIAMEHIAVAHEELSNNPSGFKLNKIGKKS